MRWWSRAKEGKRRSLTAAFVEQLLYFTLVLAERDNRRRQSDQHERTWIPYAAPDAIL
jgi:hypothetical protein